MQTVAQTILAGTALTAGLEIDMLPGGTAGWNPNGGVGVSGGPAGPGADTIQITLKETGNTNPVNTVKVYTSSGAISISSTGAVTNSALIALSATTSVSAGSTREILIKGYGGGPIRVTGNSTSGATGYADVVSFYSGGVPTPFQVAFDGVVQGQALGGTITGNLAQSGGTVAINGTGTVTLDGSTSVTVAGTNATSLVLGASGIVPSLPGGVSVGAGKAVTGSGAMTVTSTGAALTITAAAASTWSSSAGALTVDSAAALNLGTANSTSQSLGKAATTCTVNGSLKVAQGFVSSVTAISDGGSHAYAMVATDCTILVGTTSAAFTVTLLSTVPTGTEVIVKDQAGTAATRNITVRASSGNMDGTAGGTGVVISSNFGVQRWLFDGTNWNSW